MEFNGLLSTDFDFFRKKDKMTKDEYEKGRNDVKNHFRGLCYEMQKIYHRKTNGVLEINKDFQNFNKKCVNIFAEFGGKVDKVKKVIEMNTENISIKLILESQNEDDSKYILDLLYNKKDKIWEYVIADKHNQINCGFKYKNNRVDSIKYNSLDINTKNYEAFIGFIENNVKTGKVEFEVSILHTCPKNEAVKQSKNLPNIVYGDMISINELYIKLCS